MRMLFPGSTPPPFGGLTHAGPRSTGLRRVATGVPPLRGSGNDRRVGGFFSPNGGGTLIAQVGAQRRPGISGRTNSIPPEPQRGETTSARAFDGLGSTRHFLLGPKSSFGSTEFSGLFPDA
jgi:hypothetical protein